MHINVLLGNYMRTVIQQKNHSFERGRAFTEFLIIVPTYLLLVFGLFDFGRVLFLHTQVLDAASISGREASVAPRDTITGNDCRQFVLRNFSTKLAQFRLSADLGTIDPVTIRVRRDLSLPPETWFLEFDLAVQVPCMTCPYILGRTQFSVQHALSFPIEDRSQCG